MAGLKFLFLILPSGTFCIGVTVNSDGLPSTVISLSLMQNEPLGRTEPREGRKQGRGEPDLAMTDPNLGVFPRGKLESVELLLPQPVQEP